MSHSARSNLNILVVEDDSSTSELICKVLKREGWTVQSANTVAKAIALLTAERFSLVLLDHLLGDEDGWHVHDIAKNLMPAVPVILVTGTGNERIAVQAMRRGLSDYVIKDNHFWNQLPEIVRRSAKLPHPDSTHEELAAKTTEEDFHEGIIINSPAGIIVSWDAAAEFIFGFTASEMIGKSLFNLFPISNRADVQGSFDKLNRGKQINPFTSEVINKSRKIVRLSVSISPSMNNRQEIVNIVVKVHEVISDAPPSIRATCHWSSQLVRPI